MPAVVAPAGKAMFLVCAISTRYFWLSELGTIELRMVAPWKIRSPRNVKASDETMRNFPGATD